MAASLETRRRVLRAVAFVQLVLIIILVANLVINYFNQPTDYSKYLSDPVLRVTDDQITPNGEIHFHFRVCNQSADPIALHYTGSLRAINPLGISVPTGKGEVVRNPGCFNKDGVTFLPQALQVRSAKLLSRGITPHYYFSTIYHPVDGGTTTTVQSNTFAVVGDQPAQ